MKLIFRTLLELLFPKTDDEKIIGRYTIDTFCKKSNSQNTREVWSLLSFADPAVRAAIHLNKFHNHQHAQELLAQVLRQWLRANAHNPCILIPIPLSTQRLRERGHNQVTTIAAKAVHGLHSMQLCDGALIKIIHTKAQTSLPKKERLHNLQGAYTCSSKYHSRITGAHIVLLDDVTTTGTTLCEAKATLLPHKPLSITCVALAH